LIWKTLCSATLLRPDCHCSRKSQKLAAVCLWVLLNCYQCRNLRTLYVPIYRYTYTYSSTYMYIYIYR
jgi:hypothetical protein